MAGELDNKLRIKLHVYDTEMSVTVSRDEEPFYRKAGKRITDTVNKYAAHFKGKKSDKDILLMTLVEIALLYEKEAGRNDVTPFNNILSKLTAEIEDALK